MIDVLYGASVDGVAGFDGREFIDAAISENLFIVALDEKGQWFRFHHLFREFLQEQLRRSMSAQAVDTLHLSAATWFESEGQMTQAIRHAVSTRDSELAVT